MQTNVKLEFTSNKSWSLKGLIYSKGNINSKCWFDVKASERKIKDKTIRRVTKTSTLITCEQENANTQALLGNKKTKERVSTHFIIKWTKNQIHPQIQLISGIIVT